MTFVHIESLDQEGRGLAHHADGKVVFVEGALPGEDVEIETLKRKPSYELARVARLVRASSQRVTPRCPYFGVCGGCSLQHLEPSAQIAVKQRVLEDAFWHIARLRPQTILPPIQGPSWGYRRRARLSVRFVPKKGGVLVGFHERKSSYIAVMDSCAILPAAISSLLPALKALVAQLSIRDRLPQIEVAVGEDDPVLVLRHLTPLSAHDESRLLAFAATHGVRLWLQPAGPESAEPLQPSAAGRPFYTLGDFGIRLAFRPTDFTQVNHDVNRVLVRRALSLMEVRAGERIADMFCGLGNFTLPLARLGAQVVGVEGNAGLIERARRNAEANGLAACVTYHVADLFDVDAEALTAWGACEKMLIDPPREGAIALVKALATKGPPFRIVYVSCNPATLARDAAALVHEKGYRLTAAGIANMFPHTAHVESIACFER
ncbi:MAG: 23S rRNA (uracil(1939)-C(5))-methyltransferase RlmD [Rhodocyclaceae bacterium]|nr:23S rRNA (uracil(1939)-C(5))-methyltransferase RlmD [Rhodocyclaceae bacterium]